MKRSIFIAISILLILLLTSCQQTPAPSPETKADTTPTEEALPDTLIEAESEAITDAAPEPATDTLVEAESEATIDPPPETQTPSSGDLSYEVQFPEYHFTSINDFKTFYTTGSTELSHYEKPIYCYLSDGSKEVSDVPPYTLRGYFADVYELFPGLKSEDISLTSVQITRLNRYSYNFQTNDGKCKFYVELIHQKDVGSTTVEEIAATASPPIIYEIVYEDYTKSKYKPSTWKTVWYISAGEGYTIIYDVDNGRPLGTTIRAGDFCVKVGCISYAPSAVGCLFRDTPERDEAIKRIVAYCQALQKEHA